MNKLTKLPKAIGELRHLEVLSLMQNELAIIPREITELRHLKDLDLTENHLVIVPKFFLELNIPILWEDASQGILIHDNPIEYPPVEILKSGHDAIVNFFKKEDE